MINVIIERERCIAVNENDCSLYNNQKAKKSKKEKKIWVWMTFE